MTMRTATFSAGRDRYMDMLRVVGIIVVVLYHWVALVPWLSAGVYTDQTYPTLVPGVWPVVWAIDIVPLFFFVGGFANSVAYDRRRSAGGSDVDFLRGRVTRLLLPTVALLGIWMGLELVGSVFGGPFRFLSTLLDVHNTAPFGPLWFVGAYLIEILLVPVTLRLHRRFGVGAIVVMAAAAAATDASAAMFHTTWPLLANWMFVWLVPHQLGYFYADGRLRRLSWRRSALLALSGLAATALLTSLPDYPRGLLNPLWRVAGTNAFTLPLDAQAVWIIGASLTAQRPLRWLMARIGADWLDAATAWVMPVFICHASAYLIAVLVLQQVPGVLALQPGAAWWEVRPLVVVTAGAVLIAVLSVLAYMQRRSHLRHGLEQRHRGAAARL